MHARMSTQTWMIHVARAHLHGFLHLLHALQARTHARVQALQDGIVLPRHRGGISHAATLQVRSIHGLG